jgi:hypothetical protein
MIAPVTGFDRVAGHLGDLNSQALRYEIETLRDMVQVLAPIAEIFSGLIGSTVGAARGTASSMLLSFLVGGLLSSDVVNNPASSYNKGGTLVEQAKALDTARQGLSTQAEELRAYDDKSKVTGNKRTPPKPSSATDFIEQDSKLAKERSNLEEAAKDYNKKIKEDSLKIESHFMSDGSKQTIRDLERERDIYKSTGSKEALELAEKTLKIARTVIEAKPGADISNVRELAKEVIVKERIIAKEEAKAAQFGRLPSTRREAQRLANEARTTLSNSLDKYGISHKDLVS